MVESERLGVLHDHYKETFARIRELEKSRDRLFLVVVGLFGLLAVQVGYPSEFSGSVDSIALLGTEFQLGGLPLAALLSATWVFTLAIGLRYCQITVAIIRQYPYLHHLEDVISPLVGDGRVYRREGQEYESDYPVLLDVAWIAYVFIFPAIVLTATVALIVREWACLSYPVLHKIFDTLIGVMILLFFFLYLVQPTLLRLLDKHLPKTLTRWLKKPDPAQDDSSPEP